MSALCESRPKSPNEWFPLAVSSGRVKQLVVEPWPASKAVAVKMPVAESIEQPVPRLMIFPVVENRAFFVNGTRRTGNFASSSTTPTAAIPRLWKLRVEQFAKLRKLSDRNSRAVQEAQWDNGGPPQPLYLIFSPWARYHQQACSFRCVSRAIRAFVTC